MKYQGSCHCGKVRYEAEGELKSAIACNCSMCQRKGSLLWFIPRDALRLLTPESETAADLERLTRKESRYVVLGHLQRGGSPTAFDRVLATRFGTKAVELLIEGRFGQMVALQSPYIVPVPLADVVGQTKNVPADSDLLSTARSVGISLGE